MLFQKPRCKSGQSARTLPRIKELMTTIRKYRSMGLYGQGSLYPSEDGHGPLRRISAASAGPKHRTFEDMIKIWRAAAKRADEVSDPKVEAIRDPEGLARKIRRRIESGPDLDSIEQGLPKNVKLVVDAMRSSIPVMSEEETAKSYLEFLRFKKVRAAIEEILGDEIEEYDEIELRELRKAIMARTDEIREFSLEGMKTLREIATEEIWKGRDSR